MKKAETNYAFIDGTNLYLTMVHVKWRLDFKRFRVYLREHYGVSTAYYFIGYMAENQGLYDSLKSWGYEVKHKQTLPLPDGRTKGNVDAELVLQAMIDYKHYEKAVLVTSDGDFSCLVEYLANHDKLLRVLAPCLEGCSRLLRRAAGNHMDYLDNLRDKLEYKKRKEPRRDGTPQRSFPRDMSLI